MAKNGQKGQKSSKFSKSDSPSNQSRWKFSTSKLDFYFSARFGANLGKFWACPGKIWPEFTKCSIIYLIIMKLSLPESYFHKLIFGIFGLKISKCQEWDKMGQKWSKKNALLFLSKSDLIFIFPTLKLVQVEIFDF